jgi:glycosyltransferase involved in cell wall biosynthesis
MKVLSVISHAHPLFGGAAITAHTFLKRLKTERGWDVRLATPYHERLRREHRGVSVETYRDVDELKAIARRERPDALVCALEAAPDGLRVAARFGLPSVVYLNSFEFCAPTEAEIEAWGVSARKAYPSEEDTTWTLTAPSRVVANSRFLRDRVRERHGVEADVIYPELEPSDFLVSGDRRGSYVAGICGHRYKGSDVFLALADAFPRERFLLVGDVDPALASAFAARSNVRRLGRATPRRFLAMGKVVLMPSLWPEPFGRVAVEAMACGIPTLVSRTGGLAEIVGDSPLGVDEFRDPTAWSAALESLLSSRDLSEERGSLGRRLAAPFLTGEATRTLAKTAEAIARDAAPDFEGRLVAVCGGTTRATAYSMINAQWTSALAGEPGVRALDVETASELRRTLPDATVHHNYGEHFAEAVAPAAGRLVAVRTWDFGPYPPAWVRRINDEVDLLLVYSRYVRRRAIASGIPARKVRVIPLGVDEQVFTPDGPTYELATRKRFRFLFVGAPVARKGADILLEAYRLAFGPDDDVCLVIKDHPHDVFYEGEAIRDRILAAQRDPHGPDVEYLCELMPPERLAALYRACDVGVFPYRAEGFCLPILEAMAAGVPSIVPHFGAALDFCSARTSLLMPARRISLPVGRSFAINTLGFREVVEEVEFCETPVETLVEHMRRAAEMPRAELARLARAGVRVARDRFGWEHSAARLQTILAGLGDSVPVRLRRQREQRARDAKRLEVARLLLEGGGNDER